MRSSSVALFSLLFLGCEPLVCTEMGCSGSLSLSFVTDRWEDGAYTVEVDLGAGPAWSCAFDLPLSETETASCGVFELTFDGTTLVVPVETGMNDGYTDVAVTLSFGSDVWVDDVITPDWSDPVYPNGEGCDESGCVSADWAFSF